MPSAIADLVVKGGPWANTLLLVTPFWLVVLIGLMVAQRRSLRRLVAHTLEAAPYPPAADPTGRRVVAACVGNLGPLSGGTIGSIWLGLWWLLATATAVWSVHSSVDIMRINDLGYLGSATPGGTAQGLFRQHSAVMITRGFVGVLGLPNLMITLLALDQIVFRPRTRLRDDIRRQWLQRGDHSAEIPTVADGMAALRARAAARFSWLGCYFNWIWLLIKKLPKRAVLFIALQLAISAAVIFLEGAGLLPSRIPPGIQLDVEPTAWVIFWRPFLGGLALMGPNLLITVWVGMSGPAWAANRWQ